MATVATTSADRIQEMLDEILRFFMKALNLKTRTELIELIRKMIADQPMLVNAGAMFFGPYGEFSPNQQGAKLIYGFLAHASDRKKERQFWLSMPESMRAQVEAMLKTVRSQILPLLKHNSSTLSRELPQRRAGGPHKSVTPDPPKCREICKQIDDLHARKVKMMDAYVIVGSKQEPPIHQRTVMRIYAKRHEYRQ